MRNFLLGILSALAAVAVIAGAVLYSGVIDMAADTPHSRPVYRLIEFAREQSIAHRARDITPPADLAAPERLRRGAGNYDAMCAGCHLSPDQRTSEIRAGLYPQPRDLTETTGEASAARQFWIIKHGIKATGMAAWSQGGMEDAAIWDMVALLQQLPKLDAAQYRQLVASSAGHSHSGMADSDSADHGTGQEDVSREKEAGHHGAHEH